MLEGGGVEKLFGQNPFEQHLSFQGASLKKINLKDQKVIPRNGVEEPRKPKRRKPCGHT